MLWRRLRMQHRMRSMLPWVSMGPWLRCSPRCLPPGLGDVGRRLQCVSARAKAACFTGGRAACCRAGAGCSALVPRAKQPAALLAEVPAAMKWGCRKLYVPWAL